MDWSASNRDIAETWIQHISNLAAQRIYMVIVDIMQNTWPDQNDPFSSFGDLRDHLCHFTVRGYDIQENAARSLARSCEWVSATVRPSQCNRLSVCLNAHGGKDFVSPLCFVVCSVAPRQLQHLLLSVSALESLNLGGEGDRLLFQVPFPFFVGWEHRRQSIHVRRVILKMLINAENERRDWVAKWPKCHLKPWGPRVQSERVGGVTSFIFTAHYHMKTKRVLKCLKTMKSMHYSRKSFNFILLQ